MSEGLREEVRRLRLQVQRLAARVMGSYTFVGQGEARSGIVFVTPHDRTNNYPQLVIDTETGIDNPKLIFEKPDGTTDVITPTRYADNETPSGTINGSNVTFTLAATPDPADSLLLFVNGVLQRNIAASGTDVADYSLSSATITFEVAPVTGDIMLAWYRY